MIELLQHDTNLWVALSFLIFLFVAYKLGRQSILGKLDQRIDDIKKELETAESLRVEAQELLAQFQRKQRDAEKESSEIVEHAKNHAKQLQVRAQADLAEVMQRREEQLQERLRRLEENAINEIQNHAAELAVAATTEIIHKTLDEKAGQNLTDQSISNIDKSLN